MENFDIPKEESEVVEAAPVQVEEPPKKEKKPKKQHISDERKEELKQIRIAALKKGREAAAAKRKAKKEAAAAATAAPEPAPEPAPAPAPEPEPEKLKPKPKGNKIADRGHPHAKPVSNIDLDELVDLRVNKKLLEKERIQMNNDRNKLENEITSLRRQLKEFEKPKEYKNINESSYVKEIPPPTIEEEITMVKSEPKLPPPKKKQFNTRNKFQKRVFGF